MSFVCVPLADIEYRKCNTPFFDPSGRGLPLRSCLYPPDLFTAKSFCLVEQLIELNMGHPDRCVFMKKSGAQMRKNCWYCEYDSEFKTCETPINRTKVYERTPAKAGQSNPVLTSTSVTRRSDDGLSETDGDLEPDFDSGDEKPDDLSFWFGNEEEWAFRSTGRNPFAENVTRERMPPQEISVLEGMLSGIVDDSKYYFTVNSLTSIVTVRWKHSERGMLWERFVRTKQCVDDFGVKKFHSSSSSSLSTHAYPECITRAQRWCAWHSCWIYDTRPMAMPIVKTLCYMVRLVRIAIKW